MTYDRAFYQTSTISKHVSVNSRKSMRLSRDLLIAHFIFQVSGRINLWNSFEWQPRECPFFAAIVCETHCPVIIGRIKCSGRVVRFSVIGKVKFSFPSVKKKRKKNARARKNLHSKGWNTAPRVDVDIDLYYLAAVIVIRRERVSQLGSRLAKPATSPGFDHWGGITSVGNSVRVNLALSALHN